MRDIGSNLTSIGKYSIVPRLNLHKKHQETVVVGRLEDRSGTDTREDSGKLLKNP